MNPSPSGSSHTGPRFPFRLCIAFVLAGVVILVGLTAYTRHSYQAASRVVRLESHLRDLAAMIQHLDEVLTMSARMAAFTGDQEWEARYRHFEPVLDQAIKESISLAPEAYEGAMAKQTDAANTKLVEMEHRALEHVHQGQLAEAQALLLGLEYGVQKDLYAQGLMAFTESIAHHATSAMAKMWSRIFKSILVTFLVLILLLSGWTWVLWTLWRWEKTLLSQNRELDTQAQQLGQLNANLDKKVVERTSSLEQANQILQRQITERARIEQELRIANESFQQKVKELELLNHIMLGREERIMELKTQLRALKAGSPP